MRATTKNIKPKISENEFLSQVIKFASLNGWKCAHFRASLNRRGKWQTAVQADGAGFPDLVLVRERVIWAELKSENGKQTNEQVDWYTWLQDADQEVYVWRPSDWPNIEALLRG